MNRFLRAFLTLPILLVTNHCCVRRLPILILAAIFAHATTVANASAATIFESGTLGPTGVVYADLGGIVPGTNVNSFVFAGVRFELTQPVVMSQVGGHFVEETTGTLFGAIVALDDVNDFPNSADLSTPDVLGTTSLIFPNPSAEVFASLSLSLDPGWYALVFGSGLFGTNGSGGAVRNGADIGNPTYIGYGPNLQWFNFNVLALPFDNHRFVVKGHFVPEPTTISMFISLLLVSAFHRAQRKK